MVLFKRKPVIYCPQPQGLKDDQEIWVIEETGEIFSNYEEFLNRMDHYSQRKFLCEVTGVSGLDFFSAFKLEEEEAERVNKIFPDSLREPVLRKVQHCTISRIDNLVDWVYDEFRHDFYPGESVIATVDDPTQGKLHGSVREKIRFPPVFAEDNETMVKRACYRYFVILNDRADAEAFVDDEHIFRDRKVFSKMMLRSYLRNSIYREAWTGAPWQIKDKLAEQYRIDQYIPLHLRKDAALIQRKMKIADGKDKNGATSDFFSAADTSMSGIDSKVKGPKAKKTAQLVDKERQERLKKFQEAFSSDPSLSNFQRNGKISYAQALHHINGDAPPVKEAPVEAPPKETIKYPREDLDNPLTGPKPMLKTMQDELEQKLESGTVGGLLEVWDFLNVYCEVFLLDSFTFDDFVDALCYQNDEYHSELLVELHCAVLKRLVNDEKDLNGQVQITLPVEEDDEEEDEEDEEEQQSKTRTPTPQPEFKRSTRRSLAKAEAEEMKNQAAEIKLHLGAEINQCVEGYDWKARLRKRDFTADKWIVIIVGLLNLFTLKPQYKNICEALLIKLAPPDLEATESTAIMQYALLDVNDRVKILQFLKMLVVDTRSIRDYIEECSATMTQYRKDKVEWQRKRKDHLAELKALEEERRAIQPGVAPPSQEVAELAQELEDTEMLDGEEDADKTVNDTEDEEDEDVVPSRSLRRAKDRENERKKKIEQERKRKEEVKAEKAKKPSKEARELEKVLKKIEKAKEAVKKCEAEIAICDEDLRQNDCPRLRVLGKDRYRNRYYWFERNAMPYGGMPDASTAHAEYMNGRLWLQGPDPTERDGFLNLTHNQNIQYRNFLGVTMHERRAQEEGKISLNDSSDWGFYDSTEDLDSLIAWLSEKGHLELKLKKELCIQRDQISNSMEKRKAYLDQDQSRSESVEPVTRVSTRRKTYVDPAGHRFMKWHNSSALEELGHIHSEHPRITKKVVSRGVKRKSPEKEELPVKRTRGRPPAAKPVIDPSATTTRRGTRYSK